MRKQVLSDPAVSTTSMKCIYKVFRCFFGKIQTQIIEYQTYLRFCKPGFSCITAKICAHIFSWIYYRFLVRFRTNGKFANKLSNPSLKFSECLRENRVLNNIEIICGKNMIDSLQIQQNKTNQMHETIPCSLVGFLLNLF